MDTKDICVNYRGQDESIYENATEAKVSKPGQKPKFSFYRNKLQCFFALMLFLVLLIAVAGLGLAIGLHLQVVQNQNEAVKSIEKEVLNVNNRVTSQNNSIRNLQAENNDLKSDLQIQKNLTKDLEEEVLNVNNRVTSQNNSIRNLQAENNDLKSDLQIQKNLTKDLEEDLEQIQNVYQLSMTEFCSLINKNGVYTLSNGRVAVCDDKWAVIQRRLDGNISFARNWENYTIGFGNFSGEFWLGLEQIHELTGSRTCSLRVDLWDFDDKFAYAEYRTFRIDSESNNYRLHVTGYSGTAGDSLAFQNNQQFSTPDRDNDNYEGNCAAAWQGGGGWWFNNCFYSKLNAPWGRSTGEGTKIIWYHWKGFNEALKKTAMKLRCS